MKRYTAKIVVPKSAKIDYQKALGEAKEHQRSGIKIEETESELTINVETDDITAMRASLNTLIRDIQVIEKASDATGRV